MLQYEPTEMEIDGDLQLAPAIGSRPPNQNSMAAKLISPFLVFRRQKQKLKF
jgi:hypothetical protein